MTHPMTEPVVTAVMVEAGLGAFEAHRRDGILYEYSMHAAIIAALKAQPSPWRPMAEAKRDGTEIILRRGARVGTAHWYRWEKRASDYHANGTYLGEYTYGAGESWTIGLDGDSWDGDKSPTHWQPLPLPPGDE